MKIQQLPPADVPSILLVGEDGGARREIGEHVRAELRQAVVIGLASTDRFDPATDERQYDLCIIADRAPAVCMETVSWMRQRQPDCPLLLVLEIEDEALAAEATRRGVEDYILKTPHYEPRLRALIVDLVRSSRRRGETEESLRTSAQQFHDLVENSAQGILIQVNDRPVYANPAMARILGYGDPEKLLRLDSVYDFVDPRELPRLRRITETREAGGEAPIEYVFRARRRDGGLVWLENRVNRVGWNGNDALQCNMVDVSDRQRANNALRLAAKVASRAGEGEDFHESIRTALKWLARGMGWVLAESWIPDSDAQSLEAGPSWCSSRKLFRRFLDDAREQGFKVGEGLPGRVLASGLSEWMEDVSNASGRFRRAILANEAGLRSACGIPIIAGGETLAVLCFFMTERLERSQALITALSAAAASLGPVLRQIRTEQARRASIAQAETLVNRNVDGILVVDEQGHILFCNPAAETLFGRSIEELRGMPFGKPAMERNVAEIEIHNARTGVVRVNEMRVAGIQWNGELARLVSLTDVTERLEARKALERNQAALQERVKELRCLYSVSNELARTDISWNEILKKVVDTIPGGWQHPASIRVRLRIEDEEVVSGDFAATDWSLSADVWAGSMIGRLQVFYKEKHPEQDIGPFLEEEQNLLNDLARRIGQSIASRRYQQELQSSRRRFQDFAEAASDWLWEMDENLRFTYFSDRIESVMGQPVSHWLGKTRRELTGEDPDNDPKWEHHRAELEARRPFRDFRYEIALPNGSVKHIAISGVPVFDDQGRFRGYRGSGTDETRAVEGWSQALESERRLQSIADRLPGVVFQRLRKPDGRVEYPYLSAGIEAILGYNAEEVSGDPLIWTDLIHPEDRPRFDVALADSGRTLEPMDCKFRMANRSGEERWVWHRSRPRRLESGDMLWDCIELDITEQKRVEARVQYLGYHDQLTGVPNRDLFVERLNQVLPIASRNQQTVAVAMLGLKRFKQVNEEFGMAGGDEVLRVAADRFRDCLRPGDTVARLGGDRFLFLLPSVSEDPETHRPFRRLTEAMEQPFTINQRQILMAFNMGIAVFPEDGDSAEELIQKADTAQAHYGRWGPGYGYTFYTDSMPSSDVSRLALEKELNDAIEADDQLMAYFQPLYEARTGRLIAVETLARWMHPRRGLVSPAEFIQLAEDTGLINPLGLKILRQACRHASEWDAAGYPLATVTVNLSAKQIRNTGLAAAIKAILKETGMPPGMLVLEVTESTLIADLDNATLFMDELVAEGVRFALDDFGVGYSSLSYLGRLPVFALKIDRSFIRDLGDDPRSESTIRAVVALAHALSLLVVAEGVETAAQLEHLKRLGVDTLQGFHLGRPMPAGELETLLRRCRSAAGIVEDRPPSHDSR